MGTYADLCGPMGAYGGLWELAVTYKVYGDLRRALGTLWAYGDLS